MAQGNSAMTLEFEKNRMPANSADDATAVDESKKTILIYSPDLNFCFSLSMLFQDRYNVITTTNSSMLEELVVHYAASLLIVDASPSDKLIRLLHHVKELNVSLPIIMLYVFSPKESNLDTEARREVDAVFYKPFDLAAMSRRINELLP
jgi:response regulator RpfG family c-di-GMP phosphodiesterase